MRPTYKLKDAKRLMREGKYRINPNAMAGAFNAFGWREADIKSAFRNLNSANRPEGHFHKTEESENKPGVMLDFYKGVVNEEEIYTHFYLEDGWLIINSFKERD